MGGDNSHPSIHLAANRLLAAKCGSASAGSMEQAFLWRYPASDSALEWGNEILANDQMVVECFLPNPLKGMLNGLGKTLDSN